jgi:hypothetical protein
MSTSNALKAGGAQTAGGGGKGRARGGAQAQPETNSSAQAARRGNRTQAEPTGLEPRALQFDEDNASSAASSSSSPAADARASAAVPTDVLRALQDMQTQITQLSLEADKWRAAATARREQDVDSSSSNGSETARRTRIERKQLSVVAPSQLAYAKAHDGSALEDWIDGMELMFYQLGIGEEEHEARLAEVQIYADRDVRRWWSAQSEQANADGAPIDTWKGFLHALRAQFVPEQESQVARNELINIRQHAGEAMSQYFLRATRLFARTNGSFDDSAAMHIVLDRVRKDEWRYAFTIAQRDVMAGKIKTLAQLRACLQREALSEPGKAGQRAPQQQPNSQQQRGGAPQRQQQKMRAAAAAVEEGDATGEDDDGELTHVAPAQVSDRARAPGGPGTRRDICARCKQPGHRAQQCTKPDNRKCYVCDETGHVALNCPLKGSARAASKNA